MLNFIKVTVIFYAFLIYGSKYRKKCSLQQERPCHAVIY